MNSDKSAYPKRFFEDFEREVRLFAKRVGFRLHQVRRGSVPDLDIDARGYYQLFDEKGQAVAGAETLREIRNAVNCEWWWQGLREAVTQRRSLRSALRDNYGVNEGTLDAFEAQAVAEHDAEERENNIECNRDGNSARLRLVHDEDEGPVVG